MVDFEILTHQTIKNGGSFSYYGFGRNYINLVEKNIEGNENIIEGVYNKLDTPSIKNYRTNNSSIINQSTINQKKERKKPAASNDEIVAEYTNNEELKLAIFEYIKMRKMMKKPLTDHALKLMQQKLDKMTGSEAEKIEIINQSITRGWLGIFPIKESGYNNSSSRSPAPQQQKQMSAEAEKYLQMIKGSSE